MNKKTFMLVSFLCSVLAITSFGNAAMAEFEQAKKTVSHERSVTSPQPARYETSSSCSLCHEKIYEQFSESMHAKSFENPAFRTVFFEKLLPLSQKDKSLSDEAAACIGCHSPVTFARTKGNISSENEVDPDASGVECDICHTITGFKGESPGGGNYVSMPGQLKLGPFESQSDWHRGYSALQTKSEICAICHNRVNRYGLEIITTFSEWQKSSYAQKGIQCQDCHMNIHGFLTGGKAVYESGRASWNSLTNSPVRAKLYTHRFPGAHSATQVKGALRLDITVEKATFLTGNEVEINVMIDNSKSGHKMPTGSAELRLLILDLVVKSNETVIPIPASSIDDGMHDVSGMGKFDQDILRDDIPIGKRLYRAICIDKEGRQTLYSFDASEIVFDNRLMANEIRKETFQFKVPKDMGNKLSFIAKLYYLRYPTSFADVLNIPKVKPVLLAMAHKNLDM